MPLTILVVEDEVSNMQIIRLSLQALGHDVQCAFDPESGIRMARDGDPDVILMDMMFKGADIDGLEAIRRLKADPATAEIPIVAQTAAVLDFTERCAVLAGAAGIIHKPFRRRQLVAAIEAAIAGEPIPDVAWHLVPMPAHVRSSPTVPGRVT
ncbi:MAG: response regulator [Cyanobacteria bacterium RYN_339]|nr:response regulator [Cyanobacteria bacterium RYN_339]